MELDLLESESPLISAPLWTEDEMDFVAALLSDGPDAPYDQGSPVSHSSMSSDEQSSPVSSSGTTSKKVSKQVSKHKNQRKSVKKLLTPEEKAAARRASHRETMRRSRQRFRDQIAAMVTTVEELEAVKEKALELQMQRPDAGLQGQVAHLEKQKEQLLSDNDALHAQLVDSLLAITRAHPNNFEHDQVQQRVKGNGEKATGQDFCVLTTDKNNVVVKRDPVTLCDFVTWDVSTIGHCLQLVRDSASEIAQFYSNSQPVNGNSGDMMGWRQHRNALVSDETCVEFAFDKVFSSRSASEMFSTTWQFCRNQQTFATLLEPIVHRLQLEVLHQVNDDIVVVRRMQQDLSAEGEKQTPVKYRSIYLLHRMTSPAGLFVVLRSVNPSFTRRCGCANNLWFESFLWFGFSSMTATEKNGGKGCRVRFGGSLDGHSKEFARRWQREIFFLLLRWETHNVAPIMLVES